MVIRGRAPLRVSFGGGGMDMTPFYAEQGGVIIGSVINKYAYCSIVPRMGDQVTIHSLDSDMIVKYNIRENHAYDGRLDLVTAALKVMGIRERCEMYFQCDTPPGPGLGISSTVMVSLLTIMTRWKGVELDAYALAGLAYQVEREDLRIDGGCRDQYASTFDGLNFVELHRGNNVAVNPLRIKKNVIHELQYNLLLCYTGKIHVLANIIRDRVNNYTKKDAFDAMCETKALIYAMKDGSLKGNLHSFGKLLDYGQESKKKMSGRITNSQIGELYEEAKKTGALGGKPLGASGDGHLLMYCPYNVEHKVAAWVEEMGGQLTDWNFELRGIQAWIADKERWTYDKISVKMPDKSYKLKF